METIIGKNFPRQVIPLIDGAQKSIKIIVFDWRWYPNDPGNPCQLFNASIVRAARRGVPVHAIVNSPLIRDPLKLNGILAKIPAIKNRIHIKMIIVDDRHVVFGSHNFSQSAFTSNIELSAVLRDTPKIADFVLYFDSVWRA